MTVTYEWDVEQVEQDEHEDIREHFHQADYIGCLKWMAKYPAEAGTFYRVALVRDDDDGREWAYVVDGVLQPFEDANGKQCREVPKRYRDEFDNGKYKAAWPFPVVSGITP